MVGNEQIQITPSVTHLDVQINDYFSWTNHVNTICRNVFTSLYSLKRMKNFVPIATKNFFVTMVIVISFAIYLPNYSAFKLVHTVHIQFEILGSHLLLLPKTKWDHSVIKGKATTRVSKIPKYLADRFKSLNINHNYHTRSCNRPHLIIPIHKSKFFSQSFAVFTGNDLPSYIKVFLNTSDNPLDIYCTLGEDRMGLHTRQKMQEEVQGTFLLPLKLPVRCLDHLYMRPSNQALATATHSWRPTTLQRKPEHPFSSPAHSRMVEREGEKCIRKVHLKMPLPLVLRFSSKDGGRGWECKQ
ncbi:hypothetical protein PR048_023480 [Dryococelus australis]|uniref:Uncharacterized protein n=1 Tax=Dryococelus australis TaxID=614101 RepID=A0ABQ9GU68_9NEOP|nr:hypothetical protein PR048_023480 [Dryococelus australis]